MRRLLRPPAAFAALCSVAVLAGCGGGASVTGGEPISFEQLSQAARTSADASSGRFSFSLEMGLPGADKPFAFAGEGAFDVPPRAEVVDASALR
jgi:hypothetical protein